jgi:hypothetical protein
MGAAVDATDARPAGDHSSAMSESSQLRWRPNPSRSGNMVAWLTANLSRRGVNYLLVDG